MTDPRLQVLGTYETGAFDESAAEIVAHDPNTQRVFVVNGNEATIDVLDISDPTNPNLINQIDVSPAFGAGANSVAVNDDGIVAVAVEANNTQDPGTVVFFNADGDPLNQVTVGALPDMLTFTSDGTKVLVANEGEPNDDYSNDPEGSVSIIDISGGVENLTQADVSTADFTAFIGREEELRNKGVRIYGPGSNAAQDLEPEFIAVDGNDTTALVTLQENNAVAVVDIENANIVDVLPLGAKDYSRGLPSLTQFEFSDLPVLETTEGGQEILLGGLSGLWYEGTDDDGNLQFVTVPDRGPNGAPTDVDGDGDNERPFALPEYQARIVRFTLDEESREIEITEEILLNREDGTTPITGLPNIPEIDEEPVDLFGNLLEYDPFGADLEGIVINDDGTYWTVDEYRPAIYHFDVDGSLIDRFVPEGTAALAGETEGTFGTETLPAEYSNRRRNRGFEAIALDTDEDILYSFIQTPLANPDRTASDDSSVIRMLGIDPATGTPVAEYVYLLEKPTIDPDNGSLLVDKIGDAVYDA
ncbi:MAG: calcium-binding protein, partial [Okeania sp. SIO3C4]|nr:calcium-binding protein [Okeania sp. SIO3C4]